MYGIFEGELFWGEITIEKQEHFFLEQGKYFSTREKQKKNKRKTRETQEKNKGNTREKQGKIFLLFGEQGKLISFVFQPRLICQKNVAASFSSMPDKQF